MENSTVPVGVEPPNTVAVSMIACPWKLTFGVDSIQRIAADAALHTGKAFEPVCLAHRQVTGANGRAELYFVPFVSDAFTKVRVDLVPAQPEHGGIGIYEPSTLIPALIVGSSDADVDGWWPLTFDQARDCEAPVTTQ